MAGKPEEGEIASQTMHQRSLYSCASPAQPGLIK